MSSVRSELRKALRAAEAQWWRSQKISSAYREWELGYSPCEEPEELQLPKPLLSHFLALRIEHGDFKGYHQRFNHPEALVRCPWCNGETGPKHLIHCQHSIKTWNKWPCRPKR